MSLASPSSTRLTRAARPAVAGETGVDVVDEAPVDLEDDFELARDEDVEPLRRPAFQGFRKQGVVGVGEGPLREVPGLVPAEARLVEQDAHQFRDGESRMRVVELNGGFLRQRPPVLVRLAEPANEIGERTGDEEIFLDQTERAALLS